MGRKRTSKKERISISVDKELIEKLREFELDRSLVFTNAAKKVIEEFEMSEKEQEN